MILDSKQEFRVNYFVPDVGLSKTFSKAMEILDGNEFCAEMSDDFSAWKREKAEVAKQRAEVTAQAKAKGII